MIKVKERNNKRVSVFSSPDTPSKLRRIPYKFLYFPNSETISAAISFLAKLPQYLEQSNRRKSPKGIQNRSSSLQNYSISRIQPKILRNKRKSGCQNGLHRKYRKRTIRNVEAQSL